MRKPLRVMAEYRQIELHPLAELLMGFANQAQTQWALWLGRQSLEEQLPNSFEAVLEHVAAFADPVMSEEGIDQVWSPTSGWRPQDSE